MNLSQYSVEFRRNLTLAYPVILSLLGHSLVQFVDNIMVGQLGTTELASISLANSFFYVPLSVAIGFSTAITPLVAKSVGEDNVAYGKSALKHGTLLCLILGIVLTSILFLVIPVMNYMKQDPDVVELAKPYLIITAISLIPMVLFQALKQFADGMSVTKIPMVATIVANLINVILNYLLIFGAFGFPKMGIVGAAIGTFISRIIGLGCIYILIRTRPRLISYITHWNWRKIERKVIKKIMSLGVPSAMQTFFEVLIFTAAIWLSGVLGKNAQAANQIALNLATTTFMVATGLGVVATIRSGNLYGARSFKELRRVTISIIIMTVIIEIVFAILFVVLNRWLPTLYMDMNDPQQSVNNEIVRELTSKLLIVAGLFQLFDGIQVVVLGALRGIHDVVVPTWITIISYWAIAFPICYYLGLKTEWGSVGIWIGLMVGLFCSAVMLLYRFNKISKKYIINR